MSIQSAAEFEGLRRIGRIVRIALDRMAAAVRPGVTTSEIAEAGAKTLAAFGAEPSPPKVYGFPGAVCISVNDEAIHGIPGSRALVSGDLVKLDLTADKDGFVADAAVSVIAGDARGIASNLLRCAERAFRQGAQAARAGNRVCEIGRAVERETKASGFRVMRALAGHGVGRAIHEDPVIPNFYDRGHRARLKEGLVITIEPIIAAGSGRERLLGDGWTIATEDGALAAHYEHTLVITRGEPILLTAA